MESNGSVVGEGARNAFAAALSAVACRALGGPVSALRRLTGGASQELWSFDAGGRGYVLRRTPGGGAERLGATGMRTEAAVIRAVALQGVPVPEIVYVLRDEDALGIGFIATREPGEALGQKIVGDAAFADIRPTLAARCGEILARIHGAPPAELPALSTRSPRESIDQLDRQLRSFDEPRPVFEMALAWLKANCPEAGAHQLVHADFRNGNFLLEPDRITAILDWEGCHLGDPMEDLGWLCMPIWRFGRIELPVGGFGQREDLFEAYGREAGIAVDPARVRFWEVRGMLRWGLTCMYMADAFLRGERSLERAAVGRRASEAEIELLNALVPRSF